MLQDCQHTCIPYRSLINELPMTSSPLTRLEQYSLRFPQEVLWVQVQYDQQEDELIIFKGFSSSLQRSTPANPDISLIPDYAHIVRIDRLKSPYTPEAPEYIEQNLSWSNFEAYLNNL